MAKRKSKADEFHAYYSAAQDRETKNLLASFVLKQWDKIKDAHGKACQAGHSEAIVMIADPRRGTGRRFALSFFQGNEAALDQFTNDVAVQSFEAPPDIAKVPIIVVPWMRDELRQLFPEDDEVRRRLGVVPPEGSIDILAVSGDDFLYTRAGKP